MGCVGSSPTLSTKFMLREITMNENKPYTLKEFLRDLLNFAIGLLTLALLMSVSGLITCGP
jgi:hypothetical protein